MNRPVDQESFAWIPLEEITSILGSHQGWTPIRMVAFFFFFASFLVFDTAFVDSVPGQPNGTAVPGAVLCWPATFRIFGWVPGSAPWRVNVLLFLILIFRSFLFLFSFLDWSRLGANVPPLSSLAWRAFGI